MTESVERAPLTGYWRLSMYGRQAFLGDSKAFEQVLCVSLISPFRLREYAFLSQTGDHCQLPKSGLCAAPPVSSHCVFSLSIREPRSPIEFGGSGLGWEKTTGRTPPSSPYRPVPLDLRNICRIVAERSIEISISERCFLPN